MRYSPIEFKRLVAIVLCALLLGACSPEFEAPNVVIILSDDQGWADIGYNNPNVYSPNLDQLAQDGALFEHHYVMPQCTPTRVALMTGKYPGRFGPEAQQASNRGVLPPGTPTIASMFKDFGYSTYMAGKWHLGSSLDSGPNHYGFDESYGTLTGATGMYDHRYRPGDFENTWHRNLNIIEGGENGVHATDLITEEAIRVINLEHEVPFFLYLPYTAVHTPLDERGSFIDEPTALDPVDSTRWTHEDEIPWFNDPAGKIQSEPDPEKRLLLAAVHHLDDAIGKVVEALENTGQRQNTLILFSSDNGPQVRWAGSQYPDDLMLTDFNQPLPMRGSKTDVFEGGIHVPAFANWPGHIEAKTVSDAVHIVDWLPTLTKLASASDTTVVESDGIDLSSVIFGTGELPGRDFYWTWHRTTNRRALRSSDWKIVKYGIEEPQTPGDWLLFNLHDDPMEELDIATEHPQVVQDLHARYLAHRAKDKQ